MRNALMTKHRKRNEKERKKDRKMKEDNWKGRERKGMECKAKKRVESISITNHRQAEMEKMSRKPRRERRKKTKRAGKGRQQQRKTIRWEEEKGEQDRKRRIKRTV